MVEFSNSEELDRWLKSKPREWSVVIAARTALRVAPLLGGSLIVGVADGHDILTFRAISPPWVAATWPSRRAELRVFATMAAKAARGTFRARAVPPAAARTVYTRPAARAAADVAAAAARASNAADIWAAVSADATELEIGDGSFSLRPNDLAIQALWPTSIPQWAAERWLKLKTELYAANEDWAVWISWYEARLRGGTANEELELARVMIADEIWRQGPEVVNAHIKGLIKKYTPHPQEQLGATRAQLAEVVSPAPSVATDGRLDAGPNATYDSPTASLDLPSLPIRQRALVQTILSGLPSQAPKHLKATLGNYDDELRARGVQPILGLLKDMAAIIEADIGARNARREWLEAGLATAFDKFLENNELFSRHFPLDLKRDELYANTPVDESAATGPALSKPFEDVAKATAEAHGAGMTTDEFVKIIGSLTEFAKVTSTLPSSQSRGGSANADVKSATPLLAVSPEDRIARAPLEVSATKRTVLTGIGFFERVYNLVGSTASLLGISQGTQLMTALRKAIDALSKFLG